MKENWDLIECYAENSICCHNSHCFNNVPFKAKMSCKHGYIGHANMLILFRKIYWLSFTQSLLNECLHFDLESCNLMCTYTVVTHPCHIPPLAQARPAMPCIYTSTRYTYSQCMPRAHLHDLWTNTCGLIGVAHALGRSVMHVQWSVKSVRRKVKRMHYVEKARECERIF